MLRVQSCSNILVRYILRLSLFGAFAIVFPRVQEGKKAKEQIKEKSGDYTNIRAVPKEREISFTTRVNLHSSLRAYPPFCRVLSTVPVDSNLDICLLFSLFFFLSLSVVSLLSSFGLYSAALVRTLC